MKVLSVFKWSMGQLLKSSQGVLVIIISMTNTYILVSPFARTAKIIDIHLTPAIYPLLINDKIGQLIFLSGYILLLTTIMQDCTYEAIVLPRVGASFTSLGILLQLIMIPILYQTVFTLFSQLWLLNVTEWSLQWGEGWQLLTEQSNWTSNRPIFFPSSFMVTEHTMINATVKTYFFESALLIMIGLIFQLLKCLIHPVAGLFTVMFISLTDVLFYNMFPIPFRIFSPVSLAMLSTFQLPEKESGITEEYSILFFMTTLTLLTIAFIKSDVIWRNTYKKGCLK